MDKPKIGAYTAKRQFVFHCPGMNSTVSKGAVVRITQINEKAQQVLMQIGQHSEWFSLECAKQWLQSQWR